MNAEELDKIFDDNQEDIIDYLDLSTLQRPAAISQKKVIVDFPEWMFSLLEQEANKIGITTQSIIKIWLEERLKKELKLT